MFRLFAFIARHLGRKPRAERQTEEPSLLSLPRWDESQATHPINHAPEGALVYRGHDGNLVYTGIEVDYALGLRPRGRLPSTDDLWLEEMERRLAEGKGLPSELDHPPFLPGAGG